MYYLVHGSDVTHQVVETKNMPSLSNKAAPINNNEFWNGNEFMRVLN